MHSKKTLLVIMCCIAIFSVKNAFTHSTIKAIIFDCDGVLVDSEHSHYLSWQYALEKYGYNFSLESYYYYVGRPSAEIAKILAKEIGVDCTHELLKDKRAYYHQFQMKGIPAIQPTIDFVHLIAKEKNRLGFKLAVASAAKKEEIFHNLKQHGIEKYFDIILSGQDDLSDYHDPEGVNKSKPYIYLHAAKMLGISPEQCVVIEDSRSGISAGISAGCFTIAAPNQFTQKQDLSHASLKIDSFFGIDVDQFFQILKDRGLKTH